MNIYVYGKGLITATFKGKMKKKPQKNVIVYLMHSKQ